MSSQDVIELFSSNETSSSDEEQAPQKLVSHQSVSHGNKRAISSESSQSRPSDDESDEVVDRSMQLQLSRRNVTSKTTKVAPRDPDRGLHGISKGMAPYHELRAQQQIRWRIQVQNRHQSPSLEAKQKENSQTLDGPARALSRLYTKKARKVAPHTRLPIKRDLESDSEGEWKTLVQTAVQSKANPRQPERHREEKSRPLRPKTLLSRANRACQHRNVDRRIKTREAQRKTLAVQPRTTKETEKDARGVASEEASDLARQVANEIESDSSSKEKRDQVAGLRGTKATQYDTKVKQFKRLPRRKRPCQRIASTTTAHEVQMARRRRETIETQSMKEKLSLTALQEQEQLLAFYRAQKRRKTSTGAIIGRTYGQDLETRDSVAKRKRVVQPTVAQSNGVGKPTTTGVATLSGSPRARVGVSETPQRSGLLSLIGAPPRTGDLATTASRGSTDSMAHPISQAEDTKPVLHSTAWRRLVFQKAPPNLLPVPIVPYSTEFDRPLWDYDQTGAMKHQCTFLIIPTKQARELTDTQGGMQPPSQSKVNTQVRKLVALELPRIQHCHVRRLRHIVQATREQLATYFQSHHVRQTEHARRLQWVDMATHQSWVDISPIERATAKRVMQDPTRTVYPYNRLVGAVRYDVHHPHGPHASVVYPETVTELPKEITGLRRSFTMIGLRNNVFVEDDPILRYVPYFGDGEHMVIENDLYTATTMRPERRVAVFGTGDELPIVKPRARDTEMHEYLLRIIVNQCGPSESVFHALEHEAGFDRPRGEYDDLTCGYQLEVRTARRLAQVKALTAFTRPYRTRKEASEPSLVALARLARRCWFLHDSSPTPRLATRLLPPVSVFESNYAHSLHALGLRDLETYEGVAEWYRDLFCRQCFTYDCSDHGIQNPPRNCRADPVYPMVRTPGLQPMRPEAVLTLRDKASVISLSASSSSDENVETCASRPATAHRRSRRTHTQLSSMATNSLVSQEKAVAAARQAELRKRRKRRKEFTHSVNRSEYVDPSYVPAVTRTMQRLLSKTLPCSAACWIPSRHTQSVFASKRAWRPVHGVLVRKLATSLGDNACVLAAMLQSPSCTCAQIKALLTQKEPQWASNASLQLDRNDVSFADAMRKGRPQRAGVETSGKRGPNHLLRYDTDTKRSYKPCTHDGVCDDTCGCCKRGHPCHRACSCSRACRNRVPGCKCSVSKCDTLACPCWSAGRECDPDACVTCGASDAAVATFLLRVQPWRPCDRGGSCHNVNMLRGRIQKKIRVAFSATHGWGAFALEAIRKDDFVLEYTGELITDEEAERRGALYDRNEVSYLFGVNRDYVVDAARKGNKAKFANHRAKRAANLDVRIIASNGDHRIGLFASEAIQVGAELFFDYGYTHETAPRWSLLSQQRPAKRSYAVKDDEKEWEYVSLPMLSSVTSQLIDRELVCLCVDSGNDGRCGRLFELGGPCGLCTDRVLAGPNLVVRSHDYLAKMKN